MSDQHITKEFNGESTATLDIVHDFEDDQEPIEDRVHEVSSVQTVNRLSVLELALCSIVAAGIQFGWALQLSLLTPYIQTLGIDHSFSSFIWLCGPVTGLVVQPCVGIWSDKCKSKWGRRRPFIFVGSIMVCFAVIIIGFAADIGYLLGDTHEDCHTYKGTRSWAAAVFVLGFWLLDLANNTVQGPARALLADLAGANQRFAANAIFCLWMALGNILGFSTGASGQWHRWFPFLKSQACCEACGNLKAAFILAVIFLGFCTMVTLRYAKETPYLLEENEVVGHSATFIYQPIDKEIELSVMEKVDASSTYGQVSLISNGVSANHEETKQTSQPEVAPSTNGLISVVSNLLTGIRQLPNSMKGVLVVMAFCWLSWFPFFLFDTDWMGREVYHGDPKGDHGKAAAYQRGVQEGAFGLLLNSVILGIASLLIDPLCTWIGSKYLWAASNFVVFACMASTAIISAAAGITEVVGDKHVYKDSGSVKAAAVSLFAVLGFPLAVTYSVPYSIASELTADNGGGQGLAMGVLNLAIVIPQMVVALGAGPWDELFGGGNEPAFALAAIFALLAGTFAMIWLPQLSKHGYQRAIGHSFG